MHTHGQRNNDTLRTQQLRTLPPPQPLRLLLLLCCFVLCCLCPSPLAAQSFPAESALPSEPGGFAFPPLVVGVCVPPPLSVAQSAGISLRLLRDAQYAEAGIRVGLELLRTTARIAIKQISEVKPRVVRVSIQCDELDTNDIQAAITNSSVAVILGGVSAQACTAIALAAAATQTPWISYFCDRSATAGAPQPPWPAKWTSTVKAIGAGSALGIQSTAGLGAPFGPTLFFKLNPTSTDYIHAVMDLYLQLQWLYPWTRDSQDQTQISMLYSTQDASLALEPITEMLLLVNSNLAVTASFNGSESLEQRKQSLSDFRMHLRTTHDGAPNTQLHMVVLFLHSFDVLPFMEAANLTENWWPDMSTPPFQLVLAGTGWVLPTDAHMWNQTTDPAPLNATDFAAIDWRVLDGLMGISPIPGYFTTRREFTAAVAQVGNTSNVIGDESAGSLPVLSQVDPAALSTVHAARLGYDAVSVVFRAVCEFADSLLQISPGRQRLSFLLAGAISRSSFVGATGSIRFHRDATRLGDRQTVRFSYSQIVLANYSGHPPVVPADALPLGAGLPWKIVGDWSPPVGCNIYKKVIQNTTMTHTMIAALNNPAAVKTSYQPVQRYANQFWTALRLHGEPPSARSGACFVVSSVLQRGFLVGGTGSEALGSLADVYDFDFATEQWNQRMVTGTSAPVARHNAACSTFEDELLMFGGQNLNGVHSDVWSFSLRKNTWRVIIPDGVVMGRARSGLLFDFSSLGRLLLWGGAHAQDMNPGLYVFQPLEFAISSMLPVARAALPQINQSLVALERDFPLPNAITRYMRVRNYTPRFNRTMIAFSYINCSSEVVNAAGTGLSATEGKALLESHCSSTSPAAVQGALDFLSGVDETDALSVLNFGMGGYGTPVNIGGKSYFAMLSSLSLALLFDMDANQIQGLGIGTSGASPCPLGTDYSFFDTREDGIIFVGNANLTIFPGNVTQTEVWQLDLQNCVATNSDDATVEQMIATASLSGNSTCGLWSFVDGANVGINSRASGFFDSNFVMFGGYTDSGPSNSLDVLQTDPLSNSRTPITNRLQNDHITPPPRHSHSMVLLGEKLIIFGGLLLEASSSSALLQQAQQSGQQLQGTNQMFVYDVSSQVWHVQQPKNAPPKPTFEHVAFLLREEMYVFGGIDPDGSFLDSLYKYSPSAIEWTLLGPLDGAAAAANASSLTSSNSTDSDTGTASRTVTSVWPPARASAMAFVVDDTTAFVGFGLGPTGTVLNDLFSYTFHSTDCIAQYPNPQDKQPDSPCLASQWQQVASNSSCDHSRDRLRPPHAQFVDTAPAVADAVSVYVESLHWFLVFGGTLESDTTAHRAYFLCELAFHSETGSTCTWFRIPLPATWPLPLVGANAVLLWPFLLISGGATYELVNLDMQRFNLLTFEWDDLTPQRDGIKAGDTATASADTLIRTQSWVPVKPLINAVAVEFANGAFYHGGYSTGGVGLDGTWDRNSLVAELFFLGANLACPADQINGPTAPLPMGGYDNCTACSAGTFPARGWCYACPAGTYRSATDATCIDCPSGTFGVMTGAKSVITCTPCAAGTTQNRTGQVVCDPCPDGVICLFQSSRPMTQEQHLLLMPSLGVPVVGTTLPPAVGTGGVDTQASFAVGIIVAVTAFVLILVYSCFQWSFKSDDGFQKVAFFFNRSHANRLSPEFWARKMQELAPQGTEKAAIAIDRATSMGGLFSLFSLLLFMYFIVTLSVTYGRDNVHEERSLVPTTEGLSVDITVAVRMTVTFYSVGPADSWCEDRATGSGRCWPGTTLSLAKSDFLIDASKAFSSFSRCTESTVPDISDITQCRIEFYNSAVSIRKGVVPAVVTVTRPDAHAIGFDYEVSFESGLPGIISTVQSGVRTDGSRVLRGMNSPSHINLTLTPTRYQDLATWPSPNDHRAGFLVQLNDQAIGSQLGPNEFHSDQGLRVAFALQQSPATLRVTKRPLQSAPQFVSALLGALSGVVGVLAFLMNKAEAGENALLRWLSKDKPQDHPAVRRWENSAEWQLFRARPDLVQAEVSRKSTVGANVGAARGSNSQPGTGPLSPSGSLYNLHADSASRGRSFTKLQPARAPSLITTNPLLLARGSVSSTMPAAPMVASTTPSGTNDSSADSIEMTDLPVNRRFTQLADEASVAAAGAHSNPASAASTAISGSGSGASAAMSTPGVPRASFAVHRGSVLAPSVFPAASTSASRPPFARSNSLALPMHRAMSPRSSVSFAEPSAAASAAGVHRSLHMPLVEESVSSDDVQLSHDGMLNRRPTQLADSEGHSREQ